MQVIAWRTVSEMTYNVSSATLNPTHSLTLFFAEEKHEYNTYCEHHYFENQ